MSGVMKITPGNYTHVYGTCIITGKTVHYTKKKKANIIKILEKIKGVIV